ncbi:MULTISPECIES: hypothetical protein [Yersinia pseudotuberculosis complex]|uniref:Uncharacterized protein n=2 Tax=Yersinia pseudotuberculosis complex TaxID=1649845 RepID=A0ABM9TJE3_9GAMM|nr:hypothetical protein [Yersinia wautersii]CRG52127.1 Uncharacterised protein [Yersinia wautersii]
MPYREGEESAEDLVRKEEVRKQVRSKIMLLSASLKAGNRHEFKIALDGLKPANPDSPHTARIFSQLVEITS